MNDSSEIDKLKRDIDMLKKKQGIEEPKEDHMEESISRLSRSINSLLKVFQEASEELKIDTHDAVLVSEKLDKIVDRLDKVEVQNEKIAKGLVAVADMVEELQSGSLPKERALPKPQPIRPPSRPVSMPGPSMQQFQAQPRPLPQPQYSMPRPKEKKKNFLNFKM